MMMSANDNATYHLVELDGSRLAIPIAGKRVKIFKKRQDEGPNLDDLNNEDNVSKINEDMEEIGRSLYLKSHFHFLARTGGRAVWWGWMS